MAWGYGGASKPGVYWLWLEHISDMSSQLGLQTELAVGLWDMDNLILWAQYDNIHVGKEDQFYLGPVLKKCG
jgi:hypothetical protein